MQFIILAIFAMLLFLPGVSPADTVGECRINCSAESEVNVANCSTAGEDTDQIRQQCLQDNQNSLKDCLDACQQAASGEEPTNVPADVPKNTEERPIDALPIAPPN